MQLTMPHLKNRSHPPGSGGGLFDNQPKRSSVKAFTFVEIVVVSLIISILAAIAIPNFLEFQVRARVSRTKADLVTVRAAIEQYRLDTQSYPLNQTPGKSVPEDLFVLTTPVAYLTLMPLDDFEYAGRPDNEAGAWIKSPTPFKYVNAVQLNPEYGLITQYEVNYELSGYLTVLLWSIGPDRTENTQILPEQLDNLLVYDLLAYDPTNGTTSAGDIYQRTP